MIAFRNNGLLAFREHLDSPDCWCFPSMIESAKGNRVWVHHDSDGGEPPEHLIREAIRIADAEYSDEFIPTKGNQ